MANILTAREIIERQLNFFIPSYHYESYCLLIDKITCFWWKHIKEPQQFNAQFFFQQITLYNKLPIEQLLNLIEEIGISRAYIIKYCKTIPNLPPIHFKNLIKKNDQIKRYNEIVPLYDNYLKTQKNLLLKYDKTKAALEQLEIAYYTDKIKICGEWQGEKTRIIINNWEEIEKLFTQKTEEKQISELEILEKWEEQKQKLTLIKDVNYNKIYSAIEIYKDKLNNPNFIKEEVLERLANTFSVTVDCIRQYVSKKSLLDIESRYKLPPINHIIITKKSRK